MVSRNVGLLIAAIVLSGCSPTKQMEDNQSQVNKHSAMPEHEQLFDSLVQIEDVPEGHYSMWWASEGDESFIESVCFAQLNRVYQSAHGIETRLLARLLSSIDAIDAKIKRMTYPEPLTIFLRGPQNTPIVLTISQEKGIRLHFHEDSCSREYRDSLVRQFADYVKSLRDDTINAHKEIDEQWEPSARNWWDLACEAAKSEDVQSFGVVVIDRTRTVAEQTDEREPE